MSMIASIGWLPLLSALVLAFAVFTYVVLDGTDLGVGIIFPLHRNAQDREVMVDSILPVWDGNETWLVLSGGGLIGMFPLAYSALLTALYPVIIAMLLSLIFRGVTIEYHSRAGKKALRFWDKAIFGGSLFASFCQGVTLGAFVQGIHTEGGKYAGGWWDWLTPFSVFCGIALIIGYALLGSCWLIWRTEGALQQRGRRHALMFGVATLVCILIASLWTPLLNPVYAERWLSWPNILYLSPVPVLLALFAATFWWVLSRGWEVAPIIAALACFLLCFAGFGVSIFPNIVPPSISIPQAASAPSSMTFALVGAAVLLPAILAYSTYSFWVFRGKVQPRPVDSQPDGQGGLILIQEAAAPARIPAMERAIGIGAMGLAVTGLLLGRRKGAYLMLLGLSALLLMEQSRRLSRFGQASAGFDNGW